MADEQPQPPYAEPFGAPTVHRKEANNIQLILGVSIALAGVLFMLDNLNILHAWDYVRFWPAVFIAIGVTQFAQGRTTASQAPGLIWIAIGLHMIGRRLGFWDTRIWDYWPVLLIFFGGRIVWQAFHTSEVPAGDAKAGIAGTAVLGGFHRKIVSPTFDRADLTAFMGGGKLDLREAQLAHGEGVINIFALMGGFEILVPESWNVDVQLTPFMGGYDDKTIQHPAGTAPRLVIKGFVMMGGLDIKNR